MTSYAYLITLTPATGRGYTFHTPDLVVTVGYGTTVRSNDQTGIYSDQIGSGLVNLGAVYSDDFSLLGGAPGVNFGQGGSITNARTGFIQGAVGVSVDNRPATIVNDGIIRGTASFGVLLGNASVNDSLKNTGFIYGVQAGVFSTAWSISIHHYENYGTILSGYYGISVSGTASTTGIIDNFAGAKIEGSVAAIHTFGLGQINLDNRGTIVNGVWCEANADDKVTNRGKIIGDVLLGPGKDTFTGNNTAEKVHGGDGNDKLTGGGGADRFYFDTALNATANVDTITDFAHRTDKIELDATFFSGIGPGGTLSAASFFKGSSAHDSSDRIIYNGANGKVFFDADGEGGSAQVLFARLDAHLALSRGDFFVF